MTVPLVLVHQRPRCTVMVNEVWRQSPAYQAYRKRARDARRYADFVALLEASATDPVLRTSIFLDFAPSVPYARRFLNSTAAFRALSGHDPRRHLAERALRALVTVLAGGEVRGRPHVQRGVHGVRVRQIRDGWYQTLRHIWRESSDMADRLIAIEALANRRHWRTLRQRVIARTRPSELANYLTAWECELPVRHVRALVRSNPVELTNA